MGFKLGGRALKHQRYDNTYNLLQYSEMCRNEKISLFYTTQTVAKEAGRTLESALNRMIQRQIDKDRKIASQKRQLAENFYQFLNDCLDQMDVWLSYLSIETIDQRAKENCAILLRDEFRTLDIEFREKHGASWNDFHFRLRGILGKAAKFVRTVQRKEALHEYKPNPSRADIEIMAEASSLNHGKSNEVYLTSEDGNFCAEKNRKLLEEKFGLKCRYSHEMLKDGHIRILIENAKPSE